MQAEYEVEKLRLEKKQEDIGKEFMKAAPNDPTVIESLSCECGFPLLPEQKYTGAEKG